MTVPTSPRRRPPGRYDEPSALRSRVLGLVAVVLAVGLVAVVVVTLYDRYGSPEVSFRAIGFSTVSDTEVEVWFEVAKEAEETAYCTVRARDAEGAETGSEVVEIGAAADGRGTVEVRHRLRTRQRAVTGEVQGCSLVRPSP